MAVIFRPLTNTGTEGMLIFPLNCSYSSESLHARKGDNVVVRLSILDSRVLLARKKLKRGGFEIKGYLWLF